MKLTDVNNTDVEADNSNDNKPVLRCRCLCDGCETEPYNHCGIYRTKFASDLGDCHEPPGSTADGA